MISEIKSNLAIIIPAYKADFIKETLLSITNQSCKNFTLYIGDDNSPNNIYSHVENLDTDIKVVYKKFDSNLGSTNLVKHWNRCINMIGDEEWIWMFSDDDILEENCVQAFYNKIEGTDLDFVHFNIKVIDQHGEVKNVPNKFASSLDISTFHLLRWQSKLSSFVVEYVFKKESFQKKGGFQNFNYAWHSDEATWTKLGYPNGITSIGDCFVRWRRSEVNITSNNVNPAIVRGKLEADIAFTEWIKNFYQENKLNLTLTHKFYLTKRFTHHLHHNKKVLAKNEWKYLLSQQIKILDITGLSILFSLYYNFLKLRSR